MSGFSSRAVGLRPSAIREILKVTEMPDVISFAGGLPAPELFPAADIAAIADVVLSMDGAAALQYGTTEGYGPLREWVSEHLAETCGLEVPPNQVLITAGSQQGLDLAGKVLLDPGDIVLAENPAYLGALQAFSAYEAVPVGVPSDDDGMDPDRLRSVLRSAARRPKVLYLVTNFQNPTGTGTSPERRAELADIAAESGVTVIEDDPYGQLRYEGEAAPALCALPQAGRSLLLGTASKTLAPGLRVAWMATKDRALYERLVLAKQACDLHTSSFTQRIVARYMRAPGRLEAHLARLRAVYGERRGAMLAALAEYLPAGSRWTQPEGGLFLWARLPDGLDTTALLDAALREKVAFVPGESFWIGEPDRATLRLNFSNASPDRIRQGIRRLGAVTALSLAGSRRESMAAGS